MNNKCRLFYLKRKKNTFIDKEEVNKIFTLF